MFKILKKTAQTGLVTIGYPASAGAHLRTIPGSAAL